MRWPWSRQDQGLSGDGLGQSAWTDMVWIWRIRRLKRRALTFETPSPDEKRVWQNHPELSRFGDVLVGVATIDGRRAWVLENDWYGWPDPPRFAIFIREPGGRVWAGSNFGRWPASWTSPEGFEP